MLCFPFKKPIGFYELQIFVKRKIKKRDSSCYHFMIIVYFQLLFFFNLGKCHGNELIPHYWHFLWPCLNLRLSLICISDNLSILPHFCSDSPLYNERHM